MIDKGPTMYVRIPWRQFLVHEAEVFATRGTYPRGEIRAAFRSHCVFYKEAGAHWAYIAYRGDVAGTVLEQWPSMSWDQTPMSERDRIERQREERRTREERLAAREVRNAEQAERDRDEAAYHVALFLARQPK